MAEAHFVPEAWVATLFYQYLWYKNDLWWMLEKVEGTEPLRSQKSSSPRLGKRALGFSLNTK